MVTNYLTHGVATRLTIVAALLTPLCVLAESAHEPPWDTLPDPTRPYHSVDVGTAENPSARPEQSTRLTLQSVVTGPQTRYALINGHRVEIGGVVDRARVVAIRPHEVIVEVQGEVQVLRMVQESPKRERL